MLWLVMLLGAATGLLGTRRQRRTAARMGDRLFPGRLAVYGARSRFPAAGGAEVMFRVTDDPDAVVRLRVDRAEPEEDELRKAVADALDRARTWRDLDAAFREGGYEVYALGNVVAEPWIAADPRNGTVDDLLTRIAACLTRWSGATPTTVLIAHPDLVAGLKDRDPSAPTLLRVTARRRLAALSGQRPYYRAWFEWRDGVPVPGSGRLDLVRPFDDSQRFAAAVEASAAAWLAEAVPEATVCSATGVWRLLPNRVDRVTGFVLYRDEPEPGPVYLGKHALRVTTDLDGALVGDPTVLPHVREGRGRLHLPAL
ncbi:hypothetical protein ACIO6U_26510 [Streptomyces sp. NPDC087422]|uniref:hypothetical protein n=1 Tax=Streptomyces sp. NPDC087422 TaxID=3365786 RepID=UPI003819AAC7